MTTESSQPETRVDRPHNTLDRRTFLRQLATVSAIGAGGYALASRGWSPGGTEGISGFEPSVLSPSADGVAASAAGTESAGRLVPGAIQDRILVIVDLQGGNDGLSTLVPAGNGTYYDLRPDLAIPNEDVLALDDDVGLHPSLARLHNRGITTVEGVGPINGDLSHFSMTERWQRGDADGAGRYRTGFLGRLIDAVDDGSPLVGVSVAGTTPYLLSQQAAAMSIDRLDSLNSFTPHDWADHQAWLTGVDHYAVAGANSSGTGRGDEADVRQELLSLSRNSYHDLIDLGSQFKADDEEIDWEQPILSEGGDLGGQLFLASRLLAANVGVRVVYASMGGYDTHESHEYRQADNLSRVDVAVDEFLNLVAEMGLGSEVMLATVSEFGRRVGENDSGLDHGTASTMLLAGPVGDQRIGDRPDLDDLDDDGNLKIPLGFDRYLASLAEEWMGVEAASVLANEPEPLGIL